MDYEIKRISEIRPYENNPRNNEKSVEKVASSIREFGFLQPIVCDGDGVILAGHTRYEAAKRLGLETVPVIYAKDLTEGQAKAYRIADNKVGESSEWVEELLGKELEAILLEAPQIEPADFGFTSGAEIRRRKSWENAGKRCGTDLDIWIREKNGFLYTSFFTTGGEVEAVLMPPPRRRRQVPAATGKPPADRPRNVIREVLREQLRHLRVLFDLRDRLSFVTGREETGIEESVLIPDPDV